VSSHAIGAPPYLDPTGYARHRPEATLLHQLVERHYSAFCALRCESGRPLPEYVEQEFEAYLKCGRLEHGFLRVRRRQRAAGAGQARSVGRTVGSTQAR